VGVPTVLIANRGEIACRIIRACRALGLMSVAVYGPGEQDALHVAMADRAFRIEAATAALPYLDIPVLIAAARRAGATMLHPGYGFLSENPALPQACAETGITFVGPSAEVIRAMGDKVAARHIAAAAGVPIVPGTADAISDSADARAWADAHGYPIAVKAAGGGGGRGFRVVERAEDLTAALEGAAREGARSFGNATVYLEQYFPTPRQIEVQVLADAHGHVIHLGERDCSVQRRHQKLIEESPAPGLGPEARARITGAAVSLARAVDYVSAGTVEFIEQGGEVYFLEMNTRVQVEHPVTEMVSGVDIVQWQLRIAQGEPLTLAQDDVTPRGHAIECRIVAEDPARRFQPLPGLLTRYAEPAGDGIRVDGGYRAGDAIPTQYDSLVAKLIAHGADRDEAIARMAAALAAYEIAGVPTTIPFHRAAMAHPIFRAGEATTRFIETTDVLASLVPQPDPMPAPPVDPGRLVTMEVAGERQRVRVFGLDAALTTLPHRALRPPPRLDRTRNGAGGSNGTIASPIQGVLVRVPVSPGQHVAAGTVIAVVEAMKMENEVQADREGVVEHVHVAPGAAVQVGAPLVTFSAQ
jgi:acetyl-CoA/propionyl-CoA carboxylase, biotin carboxylase, biotin carboxyl carrier protein